MPTVNRNLMVVPDPTPHRCTAHSKSTGVQCGQNAIAGGNVCHYHGGAAPQVRLAAAARLRQVWEAAATRLLEDLHPDSGTRVKPETKLAILDKLGHQIELLEGRPTERKEEFRQDLRETLEVRLSQSALRLGGKGSILTEAALEAQPILDVPPPPE